MCGEGETGLLQRDSRADDGLRISEMEAKAPFNPTGIYGGFLLTRKWFLGKGGGAEQDRGEDP